MNERCPKCTAANLTPFEGTRALRCEKCAGFWLLPEALQAPEVAALLERHDARPPAPLEQDHRTGPCPEGHGLLRRARATNDDPFFLERCARCGGVWLDPGEWSRLSSANLLADLTNLWSPAWRDHLSEEQNRVSLESDLRQKLGDETFETLDRLAGELHDRQLGAVALAYLRERLRDR